MSDTSVIRQSGTITRGRLASWVAPGVLGDAGSSASGNVNSLGIYGDGGTPLSITNVGTPGPYVGPYTQMALGVSQTAAYLSVQSYNGAAALPFQYIINGNPSFIINADGSFTINTLNLLTPLGIASGGTGLGTIGAAGYVLTSTGTAAAWSPAATGGTVTQVVAGTGLTGGTIISTGTIALANTSVTAGSYDLANVVINAQGQVTSATSTASSGSGAVLRAASPTMTNPALGTPASAVLANATGLPLTTGVSGLLPLGNGGTGIGTIGASGYVLTSNGSAASWQAIPASGVLSVVASTGLTGGTITSSGTIALASTSVSAGPYTLANITVNAQGQLTTASSSSTTGSGSVVLATSPTLVTPNLGTPSAATLTNATGLPLTTGITGTLGLGNGGTGLTTIGANGYVLTSNGTVASWQSAAAGGIVSIVASTGLTGGTITSSGTVAIGNTGVTATSYTLANVTVNAQGQITAATSSTTTGSGSVVLNNSPALLTPNLGTPTAVTLTNGTGLPLPGGITGTLDIGHGGTGLTTIGVSGTYLSSNGTVASWTTVAGTGVTSFNTTLSGLTPTAASTGSIVLAGTLGIGGGGTGLSTIGANATVLTSNGTIASWAAPATAGTVTQVVAGAGLAGGTITSSGTLSLGTIAATSLMGNSGTVTAVPSAVAVGTGLTLSSGGTLSNSGALAVLTSVTGLTPTAASTGTITIAGTVGIGGGGTGLSTIGASGTYLTSNGTVASWATVANSGVTSFNTTVTGLTPTAASTGSIVLAGTVGIGGGGTGLSTIGGNGTLLTSNGTVASWGTLAASQIPVISSASAIPKTNIVSGTTTTGTGTLTLAAAPSGLNGLDPYTAYSAMGFGTSVGIPKAYRVIEYTDATFTVVKQFERGRGLLTLGANLAATTLARTTVILSSAASLPTFAFNPGSAITIGTAANTLVFFEENSTFNQESSPWFDSVTGDATGCTFRTAGTAAGTSPTVVSGTAFWIYGVLEIAILLKKMSARVVGTQNGTTNVYARLYSIGSDGRASKLLADMGRLGGANTGLSSAATITSGTLSNPVFLWPGPYCVELVATISGGTGTPTFRGIGLSTNGGVGITGGSSSPYATSTGETSTANDPASFTAYTLATSSNTPPLIMFQNA